MSRTRDNLTAARRAGERPLDYADRMRRRAEAAELELAAARRQLEHTAAGGAPPGPPPPILTEVLTHHAARLTELAAANFRDARFCSGIAWAQYALERVRLAAAGVEDRDRLGLGAATYARSNPPR